MTGDQVLRLVAMSMKQNVKGQDIAARYGGEEFVVALPKTALPQATTVADHIRRAVMTKDLMKRSSGERLGRVTISMGVALLRAADMAVALIERADECLYAAKRSGRNRVIAESDLQAGAQSNGRQPPRHEIVASAGYRYASTPVAGSICTDSPQPQADVWFGLLNTNCAASLSTL